MGFPALNKFHKINKLCECRDVNAHCFRYVVFNQLLNILILSAYTQTLSVSNKKPNLKSDCSNSIGEIELKTFDFISNLVVRPMIVSGPYMKNSYHIYIQ